MLSDVLTPRQPSRDATIGAWLASVPVLVWAGLLFSRVIDFAEPVAFLWLGLVAASLVCTPPLIVRTLRSIRDPEPAWKKALMVTGVVSGLLSYGLPVLAALRGLGVGIGAIH